MAAVLATVAPVAADAARMISPRWNPALIAASIAVSLLGAFTSTQLMCQARVSKMLLATMVWTMLASLTFGFCAIWCLHFVAMLACELDVPIGLDVAYTVLSALLAVSFTFMALVGDGIWESYKKRKSHRGRRRNREVESRVQRVRSITPVGRASTEMLLERDSITQDTHIHVTSSPLRVKQALSYSVNGNGNPPEFRNFPLTPYTDVPDTLHQVHEDAAISDDPDSHTSSSPLRHPYDPQYYTRFSIDSGRESLRDELGSIDRSSNSDSRRGSGFSDSDASFGLGGFTSFRVFRHSAFDGRNPFEATAVVLWDGLTARNILKGFVWSLAITTMHYFGIFSMRIHQGFYVLQPLLVLLSAIISWLVCTVGCILMGSMETNLKQQLLFSALASSGVTAMHYTGMAATTFYTTAPPVAERGYPESLPVAIASIAIVTCLAANGLLAQSATIARNKLAEIVRTRRKLWAAIAQKENAEAAAIARSEFIASASHEIRTPLHQLQGYSDLLARCPLPEDARLLLFAIQDATKTLSLITNNVLDWSRLEKGEAVCRPTNLDVRDACESIVTLLPRRDDDMEVELLVAVAPDVPRSILIDETYLHRIMMNLVSNALKFTTAGYVLLLLDAHEGHLVINVRDTGVGIPATFLPDLFEPFKQAQTRGAERGTGLGLSIVKQLLEKIKGSIKIESRYRDIEGVGAANCGSNFVVKIPIEQSDANDDARLPFTKEENQLAFFEATPTRAIEGFRMAWDRFGIDVYPARRMTDVTSNTKYAYVDIKMLQKDAALRQALSQREDLTVLVPYATENLLFTVFGTMPPFNFVPIRRPWMFHSIMQTILDASLRPSKADFHNRTVRFASEVDVLSVGTSEPSSEVASEMTSQPPSPELSNGTNDHSKSETGVTVLLVEDNKINQKLGAKMLKALGYEVMVANDGQEAIDMLVASSSAIDIILMDQSMPIKDGLTATKEIREMEQDGQLMPANRWLNDERRESRRPIIAVTAVVGPTHESMCKTVGTDAFLAKPLSLKKLRETLEEYARVNDAS